MSNPVTRILLGIGAAALLGAVLLVRSTGSFVSLLFIPLGITIGPYMGLTFPFSLAFKIAYAGTLVVSALAVIWGIRYRHWIAGQVGVVLGVVVWALTGLVGLGTGT
jgi:hypothetical protein